MPQTLSDGANHVEFDLTGSDWKSASSNWNYTTTVAGLNNIQQFAVLLFPSSDGAGEAYLDNVQLFTRGGDWTENGSHGDFDAYIQLPNIDYGTYHLYPDHWGKTVDWGTSWITRYIEAGTFVSGTAVITKPVVLEEFGWQDQGTRADVYETWLTTVYTNSGGGDNFWMLAGLEERSERLYSFESGTEDWQPNVGDGGAVTATQALTHATMYSASLRLEFEHISTTEKSVFSVGGPWDFSTYDKLTFDMWKMGEPVQVAVALKTGGSWERQESLPQALADGGNHVEIDLASSPWKSAASGWSYTGTLTNTATVQELLILLYPTGEWEGQGEAYLDNIALFSNDSYYPDYGGFTIYVTSSITPTIPAHVTQMDALREFLCYMPLIKRDSAMDLRDSRDSRRVSALAFLGAVCGICAVPVFRAGWRVGEDSKAKDTS